MSADVINKQMLVNAQAAAGTRVYIVPPSGETWKITSLNFMPNETSAADATNYASLQSYKGASTALTAARTTASTALTQGTLDNQALTAVGVDLEITQASPFSFRIAQAASGVAVVGVVVAEFDRMRI